MRQCPHPHFSRPGSSPCSLLGAFRRFFSVWQKMGVDGLGGLGWSWLMNDPNNCPKPGFFQTILALVGWRRIFHRGGPNLAEVGGSDSSLFIIHLFALLFFLPLTFSSSSSVLVVVSSK